jgi:succinate dehydrogenase / fumarate reductase cytochrome b subunit
MIELGSRDEELEPVEPRDEAINPRNVVDWVNFSRKRGTSMWAWILHRVTALLTVVVLGLHVLRNQFGVITPGGRLVAVDLLLSLVVYHGLNGVRVVVIEVWGLAADEADRLFWGVIGLTLGFLAWWLIYVGL